MYVYLHLWCSWYALDEVLLQRVFVAYRQSHILVWFIAIDASCMQCCLFPSLVSLAMHSAAVQSNDNDNIATYVVGTPYTRSPGWL